MLDIALAVLLGVLTLVTAYLGVHVTLHPVQSHREKWAYKIGFSVCGLAACILIGIQTYRNNAAQQELHSEISRIQNDTVRIEHNTEQPPRVQVNIPPPTIILPRVSSDPSNSSAATQTLSSLTNYELQKNVWALTHRMRAFEKNMIEQMTAYSSSGVPQDHAVIHEDQKVAQIYLDNASVYNSTMLPTAVALRTELWRRVGAVNPDPDSSMQGFEPLPRDTILVDVERHPVADAAAYLETLAKRLPK